MKLNNNVEVEMNENGLFLRQENNTVHIPLNVEDTEQILSKMQNPSYDELQRERRAHGERLNEYRTALQFAQEVYEDAAAHFEEQQRFFYTGGATVRELEEARTTYEEAEKRLERMKSTFEGWSSLASVTQHDENDVYNAYRAALDELDGSGLKQLRTAREALEKMLAFVNERIHEQNNHVWNFNQTLSRNVFLPRGHRLSLNGHHLAKPTPKRESVYSKKQA